MRKRYKTILRYAFDRLSEASTWRGILLIATGFGAVLSPEKQEAIIAAGLLVAGFLGVALPDGKQ